MIKQQEADLIEAAWGIIANAGGSNWNLESKEWRAAAQRWRERYHAYLRARLAPQPIDVAMSVHDLERIFTPPSDAAAPTEER